jgi:hypothetical protein
MAIELNQNLVLPFFGAEQFLQRFVEMDICDSHISR